MADVSHSPRAVDVLRRVRSIDARQEPGRSADSALTAGLLMTISRLDGELAQLRSLRDSGHQVSLMTPTAVAGLLGVSVHSIVRWTDSGQLPCIVLPDGSRRFTPESVGVLLASCEHRQVAS